jgi:hypothetical protein
MSLVRPLSARPRAAATVRNPTESATLPIGRLAYRHLLSCLHNKTLTRRQSLKSPMNPARQFVVSLIASLFAIGIAASSAYSAEPEPDATVDAEVDISKDGEASTAELHSDLGEFCFFAHLPPASQKYKIIKNIKIGKGTYGSVQDILPTMAEYAQLRGADAIVQYTGSQRFGFWPWRMVRPVVRGVAVQWIDSKPLKCESIGGTRLRTILSSGQPPAQ